MNSGNESRTFDLFVIFSAYRLDVGFRGGEGGEGKGERRGKVGRRKGVGGVTLMYLA